MELETRIGGALADELLDLAVRIAGDILNRPAPRRLLVEAMHRHDREELVDRPAVRERLKQGEVAEVPVDEGRVEILDDVRVLVPVATRDFRDRRDRGQIDLLRDRPLAQIENAAVEELLSALLVERRIVKHLAHTPLGDPLRYGVIVRSHLVKQGVVVVAQLRHCIVRLRLDVDHAQQQQRVMSGESPPRFADDMRHRQLVLAARFRQSVNHVVCVFLERVVHARLGCRAAPVVVDAQSPANVYMRDSDSQLAELGVVARDLLKPRLDVADVGDLRAEVKVNQLENVEATERLEAVDQLDELRGAQPELRFLSAAFCPAARAFRVKLDPYARRWRHAELVGHLQQNIHLAQLLEDDENLMTQLLTHQSEAHELLVLVAVAHDEVIGVLGQPQHRLELRLAAALQPDAGGLAELDDLLDNVSLLIHLDRMHE